MFFVLYVLQFARQFYIAQWYRDTTVEAEKKIKQQQNTSVSDDEDFNETEAETTTEVMQNVEKRKNFLLSQIASAQTALATYRSVGSGDQSLAHEGNGADPFLDHPVHFVSFTPCS